MIVVRPNTVHIIGPSLKPWINYLERQANEPSPETLVRLEAILDAAYMHAGINTHVITGKLRASLRQSSTRIVGPRRNRWRGELGIGKGIPYAKYELGERRRGSRPDWFFHPSHDPFDDLDEVYHPSVDAVLRAIGTTD